VIRTTRKSTQGQSASTSTTTLALALLAALLLAGAALAAPPGVPTLTAPQGDISPLRPTFRWSKVSGAATYELRVYKGSRVLLKMAGVTRLSWKSRKALPMNVVLTWKVRATGAQGSGPWSDGLGFHIGAAGTPTMRIPRIGCPRPKTRA